tara:strand:- start:457 stop:900 length:444 start_codon:yes stop_codon:yes gene_type:complete
MAHFAKIEAEGNKVLTVLAVDNKDLLNAKGVEEESVGQQYLEKHNNWPAHLWIQTSYNTTGGKHSSGDDSKALRGNYAGIGYTWDEDNNLFYPQKPFASWILNTTTATWHSPIGDAPDDLTDEEKAAGTHYVWNEDGQSWDKETPEA